MSLLGMIMIFLILLSIFVALRYGFVHWGLTGAFALCAGRRAVLQSLVLLMPNVLADTTRSHLTILTIEVH
jgi:hypothetical protein